MFYLRRHLLVQIKKNSYIITGVFIGILLSLYMPLNDEFDCKNVIVGDSLQQNTIQSDLSFDPVLRVSKRPQNPKKIIKNISRPRYYSTELGIREKIFVAIITSQNSIHTRATAINKTMTHLVDKIKFFITASNIKPNITLKNIVGFTDTREILKPFHVIKYIADNYLEEFDYFYIASDVGYFDARKLVSLVEKISVSQDVYLGYLESNDSPYCSLDAGILLSSGVMKQARENLDWCVHNAFSHAHSENLGRCISHSTDLKCSNTIQGQHFTSFKLPNDGLHFKILQTNDSFRNAISVYALPRTSDVFILHSYFSRLHLEAASKEIATLRKELISSAQKGPADSTAPTWPIGSRPPRAPEVRFDVIKWDYFNSTHILLPDDFHNVLKLRGADLKDIEHVLNSTVLHVLNSESNLQFLRLISGYRRFDSSRGMDYKLDLLFKNEVNNEEVIKRLEVCKPLGSVTVVPTPYVTENTRITLLLPVFQHQVKEAQMFIKGYIKHCMMKKDNTFLMLVLIYNYDIPSKGKADVYYELKKSAIDNSDKFKADGSKIAWVSIRLPEIRKSRNTIGKRDTKVFDNNNNIPNDINDAGETIGDKNGLLLDFHKEKMIHFIIVDLALRKVGLESLVLVCNIRMNLRTDFLNRVRMNTINGYQTYSPIPFTLFDPEINKLPSTDVHKDTGYFNNENYDIISFYSRDYVNVRKLMEFKIPIIRNDKDIPLLFQQYQEPKNNEKEIQYDVTSIFELFVKYSDNINCMRSVEPNLTLQYENNCDKNITQNDTTDCLLNEGFSSNIATRLTLAQIILEYNQQKAIHNEQEGRVRLLRATIKAELGGSISCGK